MGVRDDLTVVAVVVQFVEAEEIASLLGSHGVEATVLNPGTASMLPYVEPASGGIKVAVLPDKAQRARHVLRENNLARVIVE